MQIGFLATESYYVDHLVSIWLALPKKARGPFFCSTSASEAVFRYGINHRKVVHLTGNRKQIIRQLKKHRFKGPILTASFGNWRMVTAAGFRNPYIPHGQGGPSSGASTNVWETNAEKLDLMLCPSHYAVLPPIVSAVICGQPKLDRWYGYKPKNQKPILALSFRWRDEHSALYHYLPYLKELKGRAKEAGIDLLGHGHPLKWKDEFLPLWKNLGIPYTPSFEQVLEKADVYAADCSSSSFEFVGLDRPIIFLDCPKYIGETRAPRFTMDRAGIINKRPIELIDDALKALEDPIEVATMRRDVADILHEGFVGEASRNAADSLLEFYGY